MSREIDRQKKKKKSQRGKKLGKYIKRGEIETHKETDEKVTDRING